MRSPLDRARLDQFLSALGARVRGEGTVFLTGGATALWHGWRASTIDVDLKADPEPAGFFEAIARLKDELDVNVKLASPDLFLPELPGWRERSPLVAQRGHVEFRHYDLRAQALAKIERGHARDLADVRAMADRGLVTAATLREAFRSIEDRLLRFPALDPAAFGAAVVECCASLDSPSDAIE